MKHSMWLIIVVLGFTFMLSCKSNADQIERRGSAGSVTTEVSQPDMPNPAGVSQKASVMITDGRSAAKSGNVFIEPSASAYAKGALVTAVVSNGLEQAIYAEDMKSDCSIVILENWGLVGWQGMLNCGMERLPATSAIMPGQAIDVQINPWSSHFGVIQGSREPGLVPGKYRFRFSYRLNMATQGSEPYGVVSQEFAINP